MHKRTQVGFWGSPVRACVCVCLCACMFKCVHVCVYMHACA